MYAKNKVSKIILKLLVGLGLLQLLLLPILSFHVNMESPIFPAIEIIIVYYYLITNQITIGQLFISGIIFDVLYCWPVGTNSIVLITTHQLMKLATCRLIIDTNLLDYIMFAIYCAITMWGRCIIAAHSIGYVADIFVLIFQLCTTIAIYPISRILFDKMQECLRTYAK